MDQPAQNRTTERQWQMYASHRRRIERLIVPPQPGGKLCVLGAGNCNDLDLKWLAQVYAAVHLVDLDPDAVRSAVDRQAAASDRIHFHAPHDLTNAGAWLTRWAGRTPNVQEIDECSKAVAAPPTTPWGPCDLVLSPCVLTQTITPVRDALRDVPESALPAARRLRSAIVQRHLRLITASLKPGGKGVLVIDLVSSEKVAGLPRIPEEELRPAMDRFIASGKNFRGLDPAGVVTVAAACGANSVKTTEPWLWHLGLHKTFLTYAVVFER